MIGIVLICLMLLYINYTLLICIILGVLVLGFKGRKRFKAILLYLKYDIKRYSDSI